MTTKNPKIVALIVEARADKEDNQIIRIYNDIKRFGAADKLVRFKQQIPFKSVGGHRHNRGGLICGGNDALTVLDTVDSVGYDPDVHRDATAFEEGPKRLNEKAFIELSEQDDKLSTYKLGDMEYASVACTHFNQALAATEDRIEWDNENITIDGRLSKEKLIARQPEIAPLFEGTGGLTWTVWKPEAEELYPELPDIAQRALNAKYAAQQQEGWQIAYQRAVVVLNSTAAKKSSDAGLYAIRDINKTRPKCQDDVPHIVDMAKKFGGTNPKTFVDPVMRFVRMFMPPGRIIPGSMWKAIAALKLDPKDWSPHFINSILMLLAGAPNRTAPSKIAKAIGSGEISSLEKGQKLKDMKLCEDIIKKAIEVSTTLGLSVKDDTKHVCNLRSSLVCKVFGKSDNLKDTTYSKMACEFFEAAVQVRTTDGNVDNPWAGVDNVDVVDNVGAQDTQHISSGVVEYTEDGDAHGIYEMSLASRGFELGSTVKEKATGDNHHNNNTPNTHTDRQPPDT